MFLLRLCCDVDFVLVAVMLWRGLRSCCGYALAWASFLLRLCCGVGFVLVADMLWRGPLSCCGYAVAWARSCCGYAVAWLPVLPPPRVCFCWSVPWIFCFVLFWRCSFVCRLSRSDIVRSALTRSASGLIQIDWIAVDLILSCSFFLSLIFRFVSRFFTP